jgi:hypothetical protein
MKLSITCFSCLIFIFFCHYSFSQLDVKISAQYKNESVENILKDLSVKSKIPIYFKSIELPVNQVTLNFDNSTLRLAITNLLGVKNLIPIEYKSTICIIDKALLSRDAQQSFFESLKQLNDDQKLFKINYLNIGDISFLNKNGLAILAGTVKEAITKEMAVGANITLNKKNVGVTDENGNYKINMAPGAYELRISYIGYQDFVASINVKSDGLLDVVMNKESLNLDEVTITAVGKDVSVQETQIGRSKIDVKQLDKLPTFLGEKDIVRAVLLNPGVSSLGEGSSGYNVRGGNVDQNLMMQDEAILFNSSHALGFFSSYNADLIKDATLSKGNLPSSIGGRIASSLEVNMKDGNLEKIRYKGSINPISTTMTIDGPINYKSTFAIGVRSTFSDYIFGLFTKRAISNSSAGFYDVNAKYSYKNNGHTYTFSAYASNDNFEYDKSFGFDYKTQFAQFSWTKLVNLKINNKLSFVVSNYNSNQQDFKLGFESNLNSAIQYFRLADKFTYALRNSILEFGVNSILYNTKPSELTALENSFSEVGRISNEKGLESALFANYETKLGKLIEVNGGIRLNHFAALGNRQVYQYEGDIISENNIIGNSIQSGILKSYLIPEPRLSLKINLSPSASIKAGYAKISQFINQIFNADTPSPVSQWQLSNGYIKPAIADNLSVGIFKNFDKNNFELTLEVYKRNTNRLYDYKDFADLVINPHIETELLEGIGKSQGAEFSFKKKEGKLNGWLSYTYSKTLQKVDGINKGNWYTSGYDKPHNLAFIFNYQPILRNTFTLNFTYGTGRPSTAPLVNYFTPDNVYVPIYSTRNQIRIPDYHRLDFSYNLARSHNNASKFITSWTFTLYNVYAQKNPFSVFYTPGFGNRPQANRLAVVGSVIPSVRFNIEFL